MSSFLLNNEASIPMFNIVDVSQIKSGFTKLSTPSLAFETPPKGYPEAS